jgi:hypothetical protein
MSLDLFVTTNYIAVLLGEFFLKIRDGRLIFDPAPGSTNDMRLGQRRLRRPLFGKTPSS